MPDSKSYLVDKAVSSERFFNRKRREVLAKSAKESM